MPETLHASAVAPEDLEQVTDLVASLPQGSAVAVLLQSVVSMVSQGKDVELFDSEQRLSPNQAADLLHMSRPHLLKFIHSGDLRTEAVGSHRRIRLSELRDFMDRRERAKATVAAAYGTEGVAEKALRDGAAELSEADVEALESL